MKKIVCISATSRPDNDTAKALGVVTAELAALGCEPEVVDARNLRLAFPGEAQTDDWLRLEVAVRSVQATPARPPPTTRSSSSCAGSSRSRESSRGSPSPTAGRGSSRPMFRILLFRLPPAFVPSRSSPRTRAAVGRFPGRGACSQDRASATPRGSCSCVRSPGARSR